MNIDCPYLLTAKCLLISKQPHCFYVKANISDGLCLGSGHVQFRALRRKRARVEEVVGTDFLESANMIWLGQESYNFLSTCNC